jgi:hypothetical protein
MIGLAGNETMNAPGGTPDLDTLKKNWRRWTAIVDMFARRKRARLHVDAANYSTLHQQVVEACRSLAERVEAPRRVFYQHLEQVAGPWLNLRILEHGEKEILFDLMERCRQAEKELGGRGRAAAIRRALPGVLLFAAVAGLVLLAALASGWWTPVLAKIREWFGEVWFAVQHASLLQRAVAASVIVTLAAGYFLWHTTARR